MHRYLLPVETFMLFSLSSTLLFAALTGMQWYFPDVTSVAFVFDHYIGPLIPLFLITGVLAVVGREENKRRFKFELVYLMRIFFITSISIVIISISSCGPIW